MSTAPAAPAGAAPAPAAPAAPVAAAPASKSTVSKEIRNRVLSGRAAPAPVAPQPGNPPTVPVAPAPGAAPAAGAPPAAPAAGTPPVDPKPRVKKVKDGPALPTPAAAPGTDGRSVEQIVRDVLPEITRENASAAPAAPAVDPEVQREIDLATFAEKKHPDRYAGMAGKVSGFFKSHDELLTTKSKELGGAKSGEFKDWLESDDYKAWVAQNRPSYARGDKAKLAEDLVADRARAEARQEMEPEFKALERKTAELGLMPAINAKKNYFLGVIITDPNAEKDPALEGFAKDPIKFGEVYPEEARLIAAEAGEAVELIEEVYRIDNDLVDFNPHAPTPRQARIREFTVGQNAALRAKHPNGVEMVDGKILIDADTYHRMGLAKNPKYRVFNADEIAGMIAATKNSEVLEKLKQRRVGVTKSIYATPPVAPAAAPSGQATDAGGERRSPTAAVAAAPGGKGNPPSDPWRDQRRRALTGR